MDLNSAKVKELRSKKGWTQMQLAEISDLSLRTIQRVEVNGVGSLETSKALASAFEVERELLLAFVETDKISVGALGSLPTYFLVGSFCSGALFGAGILWLLS